MSRKKKNNNPRNKGQTPNPFDELAELTGQAKSSEATDKETASVSEKTKPVETSKRGQKNTKRGRIGIIRQTAGRGGKAVTVATGFKGIGMPEKKALGDRFSTAFL